MDAFTGKPGIALTRSFKNSLGSTQEITGCLSIGGPISRSSTSTFRAMTMRTSTSAPYSAEGGDEVVGDSWTAVVRRSRCLAGVRRHRPARPIGFLRNLRERRRLGAVTETIEL